MAKDTESMFFIRELYRYIAVNNFGLDNNKAIKMFYDNIGIKKENYNSLVSYGTGDISSMKEKLVNCGFPEGIFKENSPSYPQEDSSNKIRVHYKEMDESLLLLADSDRKELVNILPEYYQDIYFEDTCLYQPMYSFILSLLENDEDQKELICRYLEKLTVLDIPSEFPADKVSKYGYLPKDIRNIILNDLSAVLLSDKELKKKRKDSVSRLSSSYNNNIQHNLLLIREAYFCIAEIRKIDVAPSDFYKFIGTTKEKYDKSIERNYCLFDNKNLVDNGFSKALFRSDKATRMEASNKVYNISERLRQAVTNPAMGNRESEIKELRSQLKHELTHVYTIKNLTLIVLINNLINVVNHIKASDISIEEFYNDEIRTDYFFEDASKKTIEKMLDRFNGKSSDIAEEDLRLYKMLKKAYDSYD